MPHLGSQLESRSERHARWAAIHKQTRMVGWNFEVLSDRLAADEPPWNFDQKCLSAMEAARTALDMGT